MEGDQRLLIKERTSTSEEESSLVKRVRNESKLMWIVAAPAIFTRFSTFSINVISQAFVGHIGSREVATFALVFTVLISFVNGILEARFNGPTSKLLPRFRFLMFLPLPSLYFLFSNPSPLDFFSACSTTLLISLNLLLFTRLFPAKFSSLSSSSSSTHPVVWSIGSNPKQVKSTSWGHWVQVYSNGDVYEGEFQKGKCWGSGVYHCHMSGRYEGDWVDGKYDGCGWKHGQGGAGSTVVMYMVVNGSNGQCHGFGVHTCYDGSRHVGGFKWGVKHGHGEYHFRFTGILIWIYCALRVGTHNAKVLLL
ncbi:uncharacterized protein LOC128193358 [Vigna angularis]|uniref:uncharacterized protein LOC128193358 n=1 Tax=Phaseolus angularis TaxID=3914 RepID=UPI0022B561EE|nr:uncharacterized protein LOC128193358 [Vigna angularis]